MTLTVETLAALLKKHVPAITDYEWRCSCGYATTGPNDWANHVALGLLPQLGAGATGRVVSTSERGPLVFPDEYYEGAGAPPDAARLQELRDRPQIGPDYLAKISCAELNWLLDQVQVDGATERVEPQEGP